MRNRYDFASLVAQRVSSLASVATALRGSPTPFCTQSLVPGAGYRLVSPATHHFGRRDRPSRRITASRLALSPPAVCSRQLTAAALFRARRFETSAMVQRCTYRRRKSFTTSSNAVRKVGRRNLSNAV